MISIGKEEMGTTATSPLCASDEEKKCSTVTIYYYYSETLYKEEELGAPIERICAARCRATSCSFLLAEGCGIIVGPFLSILAVSSLASSLFLFFFLFQGVERSA